MRKIVYRPRKGSRIEEMCRPKPPTSRSLLEATGLTWTGATVAPLDPLIGETYYDAARAATFTWSGLDWVKLMSDEQAARGITPGNIYRYTVSSISTPYDTTMHSIYDNRVRPGEFWIMPINGGNP